MDTINLSYKLSPKLKLTPNVIQAIRLLRFPLPSLKEYLRKQIAENPLLQPIESFLSSNEGYTNFKKPDLATKYEKLPITENRESDTANLYDYLHHQLKMALLDDEELLIGEEIIANIDSNGYLEISLEELSKNINQLLVRIEKVLKTIQTFDPPGIGARDLRECLLLQLINKKQENSLACKITEKHFKDLVRKNYKLISKKTGVSVQEIKQAVREIASLNPKPGASFVKSANMPIVPDIAITKQKNTLKIALNEKELPALNINPLYIKLLKNPDTAQETKQFINERLKSALWLIKAMEERRKNILKVINAIIKIQKQAILKGPFFTNPLTLNEVAKICGLHHSTVSRIISNKYASTPRGVIKLASLFSGKYRSDNAASISTKKIILNLQQLIVNENKANPLTDQMLSDVLKRDGVSISRRTIVKYRNRLKIPPSFLRIALY